jgi:hypothetical protein
MSISPTAIHIYHTAAMIYQNRERTRRKGTGQKRKDKKGIRDRKGAFGLQYSTFVLLLG